jgi:hypothetical protein
MIEKALVSGQIARAIFQDDEQLFIINADDIDRVLDCTPEDIHEMRFIYAYLLNGKAI